MNQKPFDVTRLETLLFLAAGNLLTEAESSEISRILRDHPTARSFAARSLILDSLLIESLAMQEVRTRYERPSSPVVTKPQYMARAAAWIGAFFLIEQQAQAATTSAAVTQTTITLLMKNHHIHHIRHPDFRRIGYLFHPSSQRIRQATCHWYGV